MNLINCPTCAIVYNKAALKFPTDCYDADDAIDDNKASYCQDTGTFHPYVPCAICGEKIFDTERRV